LIVKPDTPAKIRRPAVQEVPVACVKQVFKKRPLHPTIGGIISLSIGG